MRTVILNSSHVVGSTNNTLTYNFPTGSVSFRGNKIGLSRLSIYYSWENINSTNCGWSYTWVDGTVVSLTLPVGFYTVEDMNSYLQYIQYTNGHYLVNSTGSFVYYLEIVTNPVYYTITLNSYATPTALPSGWTNPGSWTFTGVKRTPQFTISTLSSIIGITAGTYPSSVQTTDYSTSSTSTPQITPIQSVIMTCSLINNSLSTPNNIMFAFSPSVSYGSLQVIEPPVPIMNDIQDGSYNSLTIRMYDQSFNALTIKDANMVILLQID